MNLKKISIFSVVVVASIFFAGYARAASVDTEEQAFVDLVNDYRKSLGRTELKLSNNVLGGSEYFAQNLSEHPNDDNVCIHIDTTGNAPEERGKKYGYYFLTENMAWGYEAGQQVFDAWKASEGHKENMITSGARTIGIARYYNADAIGKKDCNGNNITSPWFWVADFSDEGVERLIGNNLKDSEMYATPYRKMTVTIKKWSKKAGKYKKARWAEVKVYDKNTGQLIDHDIADKKGKSAVYVMGSSKEVTIKAAKFKGQTTSKFTLKGKLTSKGGVKSKNTTLSKNIKFEVRLK